MGAEDLSGLPGHEVRPRPVEVGEVDGEALYRVGLEFGNMRTEARRCLTDLLKTVLESIDGVTDSTD